MLKLPFMQVLSMVANKNLTLRFDSIIFKKGPGKVCSLVLFNLILLTGFRI